MIRPSEDVACPLSEQASLNGVFEAASLAVFGQRPAGI